MHNQHINLKERGKKQLFGSIHLHINLKRYLCHGPKKKTSHANRLYMQLHPVPAKGKPWKSGVRHCFEKSRWKGE